MDTTTPAAERRRTARRWRNVGLAAGVYVLVHVVAVVPYAVSAVPGLVAIVAFARYVDRQGWADGWDAARRQGQAE
jgi:hypothetical protein